jgi:hypothetical protein
MYIVDGGDRARGAASIGADAMFHIGKALMTTRSAPFTLAVSALALIWSSAAGAQTAEERASVLNCAYSETATSTNGSAQTSSKQQILKVGQGVYRLWSAQHSEWGENRCAAGLCRLEGRLFSYRADDVETQGGQTEESRETLSLDLATGALNSELKNSATANVTGYVFEHSWFDVGKCVAAADPQAGGPPGTRLEPRAPPQ